MTLWKKNNKSGLAAPGTAALRPRIEQVAPLAAIPGGEIALRGHGFIENGHTRPQVRFGDLAASVTFSSSNRLLVRVPDGVTSGDVTVDSGRAVSAPVSVAVGLTIAEGLHPVGNPAVRGQHAGDLGRHRGGRDPGLRRQPESRRESATYRGLAGAHQPDQHDAPASECVR